MRGSGPGVGRVAAIGFRPLFLFVMASFAVERVLSFLFVEVISSLTISDAGGIFRRVRFCFSLSGFVSPSMRGDAASLEDAERLGFGFFASAAGDICFALDVPYESRMELRDERHLSRDDPLVVERARNINRNSMLETAERTVIADAWWFIGRFAWFLVLGMFYREADEIVPRLQSWSARLP